MAERVVIAQLVIDESGAVRAISNTTQEEKRLETQTKGTADVFTARMFNMRTAAMAFLGAFTIAGLIQAFKGFIAEVFKASTAFHEFQAQSSAAFKNLTKLAVEVLPVNESLSAMTAWLERISGAMVLLKGVAEKTETGWMWRLLWGAIPGSQILQMLDLLGKAIDKAAPGLRTLGKPEYIPRAVRLPEGDQWMQPMSEHRELTENAILGDMELADSLNTVARAHRNWINTVEEGGRVVEENITNKIDESTFAFQRHVEVVALWQQTLAGGLSLIGHAIGDSGLTARRALAMLLQQMSQMAFSFAAMHIAAAIGATTFLGAAITGGSTAQHKAAAAKWFGVGAVTAALAGHYGGSGGRESGATAYGGGTEIRGAVPSYNITFNVEGNVIGNEDFARQNAIWIKRALADGAAGGAL